MNNREHYHSDFIRSEQLSDVHKKLNEQRVENRMCPVKETVGRIGKLCPDVIGPDRGIIGEKNREPESKYDHGSDKETDHGKAVSDHSIRRAGNIEQNQKVQEISPGKTCEKHGEIKRSEAEKISSGR